MKPTTWTLPKFTVLQHTLDVTDIVAAGILEKLWHLAATFGDETGELPGTRAELNAVLNYGCGEIDVIASLIETRWVDDTEPLRVHNWAEHQPAYLDKRHRDREYRRSRTASNETERNGTKPSVYSESFEAWYSEYPRRAGKRKAAEAYKSAVRLVGGDRLLQSVKLFAASPKANSEYCPYPATWLHQGRYEDDPAEWQKDNKKPRTDGRPWNWDQMNDKERSAWKQKEAGF